MDRNPRKLVRRARSTDCQDNVIGTIWHFFGKPHVGSALKILEIHSKALHLSFG